MSKCYEVKIRNTVKKETGTIWGWTRARCRTETGKLAGSLDRGPAAVGAWTWNSGDLGGRLCWEMTGGKGNPPDLNAESDLRSTHNTLFGVCFATG